MSDGIERKQPNSIPNDRPAIWDLVIEDMRQRDQTGLAEYRTRLQPFNGRDAMLDKYHELLDAAVYHKQAMIEMEEFRIWAQEQAGLSDLPLYARSVIFLRMMQNATRKQSLESQGDKPLEHLFAFIRDHLDIAEMVLPIETGAEEEALARVMLAILEIAEKRGFNIGKTMVAIHEERKKFKPQS